MSRPLTSDWADDIADPLLREDIRNCVTGDPAKRFAGGAQLSAHLRTLPQRRAEKEDSERLQARAARRKKQTRLATIAAATVAIAAAIFAVAFFREHDLKLKVADEGRRAEAGEARATKALNDLRGQAPALRQLAESEASFQRFDSAREKLDAALALDPAHLPGYWLRAWLLIGTDRLAEAAGAIRVAQQKDPAHGEFAAILPTIEKLAALPSTEPWPPDDAQQVWKHLNEAGVPSVTVAISAKLKLSVKENEKLVRQRLDEWLGKGKTSLSTNGMLTIHLEKASIDTLELLRGLSFNELIVDESTITSLDPLRGMRLYGLAIRETKIKDLSPLRGMPLRSLHIDKTTVSDLSPLRGAPLEWFTCGDLRLADFSPLRGAPLIGVDLHGNAVRDLSFLSDSPIEELNASGNYITDLSALRGKPLKKLMLNENQSLRDLSPLRGSPIQELCIQHISQLKDLTPVLELPKLEKLRVSRLGQVLEPLRNHPSLKFIAYDDEPHRPVAEFWAEYDAQQAAGKK